MLKVKLDFGSPATVLCFGAHCDDIEVGCSGALLELQQRSPGVRFEWVIFASDDVRERESRQFAERLLGPAPQCTVDVQRFRGSYLPYQGSEVKDYFESVARRVKPDLIFTHHLADRHQDHRLVAELTWNTFRRHTILEYEIPKYEGDLGAPNLFVPLAEALVQRKVDALLQGFPSQRTRTWFTEDLFRAHLRLRGMECNSPSGFAEAFHARKLSL